MDEVAKLDHELSKLSDGTLKSYVKSDYPEHWQDRSVPALNRTWDGLTDAQKKAVRASEVLAQREHQRKLDATAAEKAQREQQERQAAFNKLLDEYKQDRRAAFAGSDSQFESVWPHLEREWLIGQATGQTAVDRERLRLLKSHDYTF